MERPANLNPDESIRSIPPPGSPLGDAQKTGEILATGGRRRETKEVGMMWKKRERTNIDFTLNLLGVSASVDVYVEEDYTRYSWSVRDDQVNYHGWETTEQLARAKVEAILKLVVAARDLAEISVSEELRRFVEGVAGRWQV